MRNVGDVVCFTLCVLLALNSLSECYRHGGATPGQYPAIGPPRAYPPRSQAHPRAPPASPYSRRGGPPSAAPNYMPPMRGGYMPPAIGIEPGPVMSVNINPGHSYGPPPPRHQNNNNFAPPRHPQYPPPRHYGGSRMPPASVLGFERADALNANNPGTTFRLAIIASEFMAGRGIRLFIEQYGHTDNFNTDWIPAATGASPPPIDCTQLRLMPMRSTPIREPSIQLWECDIPLAGAGSVTIFQDGPQVCLSNFDKVQILTTNAIRPMCK